MSKICTNLSQTEAKNIWGGAVEYVPAIGQVDLSFVITINILARVFF